MQDRPRKILHLPAKPAAEPVPKAAPAKPRIAPDEQHAREAADQAAKRIRLAALAKDAEALKISLIDRYPHLLRTACLAQAHAFRNNDTRAQLELQKLASLVAKTNAESDLSYRGLVVHNEIC